MRFVLKYFTGLIVLILFLGFWNCNKYPGDIPTIIPQPNSISMQSGYFNISTSTKILTGNLPEVKGTARYLADFIYRSTGIDVNIGVIESEGDNPNTIILSSEDVPESFGDEGYRIEATD